MPINFEAWRHTLAGQPEPPPDPAPRPDTLTPALPADDPNIDIWQEEFTRVLLWLAGGAKALEDKAVSNVMETNMDEMAAELVYHLILVPAKGPAVDAFLSTATEEVVDTFVAQTNDLLQTEDGRRILTRQLMRMVIGKKVVASAKTRKVALKAGMALPVAGVAGGLVLSDEELLAGAVDNLLDDGLFDRLHEAERYKRAYEEGWGHPQEQAFDEERGSLQGLADEWAREVLEAAPTGDIIFGRKRRNFYA